MSIVDVFQEEFRSKEKPQKNFQFKIAKTKKKNAQTFFDLVHFHTQQLKPSLFGSCCFFFQLLDGSSY